MKKVLSILLGLALTSGAMAQTTPAAKAEAGKKQGEKQLEKSVEDKRADRKEMGKDLTHLRISKAVKHRKEVRRHNKAIRKGSRHLRRHHGVKHPVMDAKKEIKEEEKKN